VKGGQKERSILDTNILLLSIRTGPIREELLPNRFIYREFCGIFYTTGKGSSFIY
jgi:hypothetical protein